MCSWSQEPHNRKRHTSYYGGSQARGNEGVLLCLRFWRLRFRVLFMALIGLLPPKIVARPTVHGHARTSGSGDVSRLRYKLPLIGL
jgi:hypothetical protein